MKRYTFTAFAAGLLATATAAGADQSRWVVAGVKLGDNYEKLFETFDKSKAMIETRGFVQQYGIVTTRQIWFYQQGAKDAPVDVIEKYEFQIRDGQVYVEGEADGEGRITEILFRQRSEGSAEARLKMLTDRYGPARKESAGTYTWGCETSLGPCLEGEPMAHMLEVRIRHSQAMMDWQSKFRTKVSAAKGESSESKF